MALTPETRQAIEDIGNVFRDAGRALVVSSHVIDKDSVLHLTLTLAAALNDLALRLKFETEEETKPQ